MDAVCFDLDGTLFDDRQYVRAGLLAAADLLEGDTGVDLSTELLAAYFQRRVTEQTFDRVLDEHGLSTGLVPELVSAYHANDAPLVPFSDAEPTLDRLRAEYDLAVVTGGTNGESKLDRLGLAQYFDSVIVAPAHGWSKREPEPFEAMLAALESTPERTVVVGDRPAVDFVQPNRMGLPTIRVERGRYATVEPTEATTPDYVVDRLSAVPEVLRQQLDGSAASDIRRENG
jgi:putative hydrolase of the HAD superfamily